jgi:hypothetical protein
MMSGDGCDIIVRQPMEAVVVIIIVTWPLSVAIVIVLFLFPIGLSARLPASSLWF